MEKETKYNLVIKLTHILIIIRRIQGYRVIDWKAVAKKRILLHPRARRRGHIGRVCHIVIRNWNILIFVGRLDHTIYEHTIEISYLWVGPVLSCFHTCHRCSPILERN